MALTLANNPTRNSATCNYSAGTGFSKPGTDFTTSYTFVPGSLSPSSPGLTDGVQTRRMEATETKYGNFSYRWNFGSTSANGQHTFTGLTAGTSKRLSATVTVTCRKTVTKLTKVQRRTRTPGSPAVPDTDEKPGTPQKNPGVWSSWRDYGSVIRGTPTVTTVAATGSPKTFTLTVYAKPAEFLWGSGVSSNQTIQVSTGLSATKWNTLVERVEQRVNWQNQDGNANYSGAEVSSNELITAVKYNILASALGVSNVRVGDLITSAVFIALQTAVNK